MARRPKDAPPDTERTIREIWQEIDKLSKGQMVDLQGRRIGNAGRPKQRRDYANKGYIDDQLAVMREELRKEIRRTARTTRALVSSGGGGGGGGGAAAIHFGYYKVDTVQAPEDYFDEVKPWTNIVYLGPVDAGTSETPPSDREARFRQSCANAAAAGFNIMLDVELRGGALTVGATLQCAQPVWDKVQYVILGDELDPGTFDINNEIQLLKNRITNLGLPLRPIGATFVPDTVLTQNVGQYNFDFINIEAYTQPCVCEGCGAGTIQEEIANVKALIEQQKAAIPATRNLTMVMQAYNRNGAWSLSDADLAELQRATWFQMVKGDSRVKALMMFAWWRENPSPCGTNHGTFGLPPLQAAHQQIWADMTGGSSSGGAKKCASDPRPCPGQPVCCDGGTSNPCECPRLCEGGSYESMVLLATQTTIGNHPELFSGGILNSEADAIAFRNFIVAEVNLANPNLEAAPDNGDGKQIFVRARVGYTFREDYRVWNSSLTVAFPPGGYRATCYPGNFN